MSATKIILISLLFISFINCADQHKKHNVQEPTSKKDSKYIISYHHYNEVPSFIKNYLDRKEAGRFLVADPGEQWDATCTASGDIPRKQFINAVMGDSTFSMEYWMDGIAATKRIIYINYKDSSITAFTDEAIVKIDNENRTP